MLFIYFCHNVPRVMRGSDRPHISPPAASAGRLTLSRYHNTDPVNPQYSLIGHTRHHCTVTVIRYLSSQPQSQQGYHSSSVQSVQSVLPCLEVTERAGVSRPAVTGEAGLVLGVATDSPVMTGVGLTQTSPVLTVGPAVVWRTETEGPGDLGRPH